jgi:hypothetical protein
MLAVNAQTKTSVQKRANQIEQKRKDRAKGLEEKKHNSQTILDNTGWVLVLC